MRKHPSIKDVALRASTSIATVSRILNDAAYPVSKDLRARVKAAISELDYRPNRMAQTLRSRQTQSIGLIVRDISNSYFSLIAKGVTDEASARGLMPLICSSKRNPELELEYMRLLAQYQVAGVILAGAGRSDEEYVERLRGTVADLRSQNVRVVACATQGVPMPVTLVDNSDIGRQAFEVLHGYGHTDILVIGGPGEDLANKMRILGFTDAAREHGVSGCRVVTGEYSWEHGYGAAKAVLAGAPEITAVYGTNGHIAVGALRYLEESGRKVPQEISVLGTGDVTVTPYTFPVLSMIKMPLEQIGAAAVRMVFEPGLDVNTVKAFPCEYVERESVSARH